MLAILLLSTAAPRAATLDASLRGRLARREVLGCAIGIAAAEIATPAAAKVVPKTNVTEALQKNRVVVRKKDLLTEVVVDPKTGDELREIQLPAGYPKSLRPRTRYHHQKPTSPKPSKKTKSLFAVRTC